MQNKLMIMETIYKYLFSRKWLMWLLLLSTTLLFGYAGMHCHLEEDIAKLLPITAEDTTINIAFSNLQVKDKIFVEVRATDEEPDIEYLTEVMDEYMQLILDADSADGLIRNTLYEVDPLEYTDLATYMVEHAPLYLDFTDEGMDTITSEAHIVRTLDTYLKLLDTEMGAYLYDWIAYDPCGVAMTTVSSNLAGKGKSMASRFQMNHLIAAEGKACIGFITPEVGVLNSGITTRLVKNLNRAKAQMEEEHPDVKVYIHGSAINSVGNSQCLKRDLVRTIGISLIIICILLMLVLRDPRYLLQLILPMIYGAALAMSGMWVVKGGMSLVALGLGAIVLGVGLSYSLHVLVHYLYIGDAPRTIREQTKPVIMGAVTTMGAFSGLLFTQSSLLSDFGAFATLTLLGATAAALIFMPHFFLPKPHYSRRAFALLERVNSWHPDRKTWICVVVSLFVIVCIAFSGKYTFDNDLGHINYLSPETIEANEQWQADNNGNHAQLYFAAMAPTLSEALSAIPQIEARCEQMKQSGLIHGYTKVSTLMPDYATQQARADHWNEYFTEERQATVWRNIERACRAKGIEADMFLPFAEAMQTSYEPECLYEAGLVPDAITCNFVEHVGEQWLIFMPVQYDADNRRLIENTLTEVEHCIVLDPFYYTASLVELIHADFNLIMLVSSIFVLIILLISYRNLWLTLIAFFPMMLSWYTVLGAMAIAGQPFNLINIVVSALVFGVGVDYSIFIMDGLIAEDKGEAGRLTYNKTAITISAVILIICMFSLLFAEHPALQSISFASLVGMITTMMISYTLQPIAYRLYKKYIRK